MTTSEGVCSRSIVWMAGLRLQLCLGESVGCQFAQFERARLTNLVENRADHRCSIGCGVHGSTVRRIDLFRYCVVSTVSVGFSLGRCHPLCEIGDRELVLGDERPGPALGERGGVDERSVGRGQDDPQAGVDRRQLPRERESVVSGSCTSISAASG